MWAIKFAGTNRAVWSINRAFRPPPTIYCSLLSSMLLTYAAADFSKISGNDLIEIINFFEVITNIFSDCHYFSLLGLSLTKWQNSCISIVCSMRANVTSVVRFPIVTEEYIFLIIKCLNKHPKTH